MKKKVFSLLVVLFVALVLTACGKKEFTVTFNSRGGSDVAAVIVKEKATVEEPTAPTQTGFSFVGWFTSEKSAEDLKEADLFKFTTPITADITLFAGWSEQVVLRFETKTSQTVSPIYLGTEGGTAQKPADPTRTGYKFGGWFKTKRGLTWLEEVAVSFPLEVAEATTLFAYWEPISSKDVSYSLDETYIASFTRDTSLILNPFTYEWTHEDDMMANLATALYATDIDWKQAVEDGVASTPGDFSKIESKEFSINALLSKVVKIGATHFPMDEEGDEFLKNGDYDRDTANTTKRSKWTFKIRNDIKFVDGTPVTAHTYEYTLKQFLDPVQLNSRAAGYFKDGEIKGIPILNAHRYYKQTPENPVAWSEVGFKVIDDYTFELTTWEDISQASAVSFGNIKLVHPAIYAASLTGGTNSTYGTHKTPFVSYGPYVIKSWDEKQKVVLNKNFDYVNKGTINYKSIVYTYVDDLAQRMALYEKGELSSVGLLGDYYKQYAESPNLYKTYTGSPHYLLINTANPKNEDGAPRPAAILNQKFRQALLYGFDRITYTRNINQPNTPSILPIANNIRNYYQDAKTYYESSQHLRVLEELGINAATEGYMEEKAKTLFNQAYAELGNTKIVIRLLTTTDETQMKFTTYIKNAYEALFGTDRLEIRLVEKDGAAERQATANWDFDLKLSNIGFGASYGAFWQMPSFPFFGSLISGGSGLGLVGPNYGDGNGPYYDQIITVNLKTTYEFLEEMGVQAMKDKNLNGHERLYNWLKPSEGKEAGIYKGTVYDLWELVWDYDTPWDGSIKEPFPGASNDCYEITAAFEKVYLEHATSISIASLTHVTMYQKNVKIEWPAYSEEFGWGPARYRYLTTDPDFK